MGHACTAPANIEADATADGLWLTSTVGKQASGRFQVKAVAAGRRVGRVATAPLSQSGTVAVAEQTVRFSRTGLLEEYTVSPDGLRQDFIVKERPAGVGALRLELSVSGARVEPVPNGARLVPEGSGRKIDYGRLRAMDAQGRELSARLTVATEEARGLAVVVDDGQATYPVRIDPTFTDANWVDIGGIVGAGGSVDAAVIDSSGNLYIGGFFTVVGDVEANYIAKWDGTNWSALGSGMSSYVYTLAVSGTNLYAGGYFTTAGGVPANHIAKWDGSNWSALGSGMNGYVATLAVSGTNVYAGGDFTMAGGTAANYIAEWNGSGWSAMGSGMNSDVRVLAASGTRLYAGGDFTTAGGAVANYIAEWIGSGWASGPGSFPVEVDALAVSGTNLYAAGPRIAGILTWNGSSWSALGAGTNGLNGFVKSITVSGTNLYAGGYFDMAGGTAANYIAEWNGSSWSALGAGVNSPVWTLAVSGANLYAGGEFTTAGGATANYISKWNGSSWSALSSGSGMNAQISALTVSGTNLYAVGEFTIAGGGAANCVSLWNGSSWSALGAGIGEVYPSVYAVAVAGTNVYVGGYFYDYVETSTGIVVTSTNVAVWDGSNWLALGSGTWGTSSSFSPTVNALAVSGTNLYAGGFFTMAEAPRPTRLRNGVEAVGRRWERERRVGDSSLFPRSMRWRCRARIYMLGVCSRLRATPPPIILPNGTEAAGWPWGQESITR